MNQNKYNIYKAIIVLEKSRELQSGNEDLTSRYLTASNKLRALETLAKWSPLRNQKPSNEKYLFILTDLEGNTIEESITGLTEDTAIEFGKVLSDLYAKENEREYTWEIQGVTYEPMKTLKYKKDVFNFKATSKDKIIEGSVQAYTLKEATNLALELISGDTTDSVKVYDIQVTNPFMSVALKNKIKQ